MNPRHLTSVLERLLLSAGMALILVVLERKLAAGRLRRPASLPRVSVQPEARHGGAGDQGAAQAQRE